MDILGLGLLKVNDWLLAIVILVITIYWYYTWNYGYWKSRGIPGPKPVFLFGTTTDLPHIIDTRDVKMHGDIVGRYELRTPMLLVKDPEFLKHVFVKNFEDFPDRRKSLCFDKFCTSMLSLAEGENWRRLRRVMTPTFSSGKLKLMFQQISECSQGLIDSMSKEANTGKAFDFKEYANRFSVDSIALTAFGLKTEAVYDKDSEFNKNAKKGMDTFMSRAIYLQAFLPFLKPIWKMFPAKFEKESREFFGEVTRKTIASRKESGQTRPDFVQLMMNAHKETNEGKGERGLTNDEVHVQCLLFFTAGLDTTSATLSFLIYNLALHPDIQEKVYEEVIGIVGDGEMSYDMVSEMDLLDMSLQETLRMYPVSVRTERECVRDVNINGIQVPKGLLIQIPIYAIHHDHKIWPEPEKFNPYRFTKEEKAKHGPYDWIPFGAGPRNCIAMRLALLQIKIVAAHLVRKYKFLRSVETEVPVEVKSPIFYTPANGIKLNLETR